MGIRRRHACIFTILERAKPKRTSRTYDTEVVLVACVFEEAPGTVVAASSVEDDAVVEVSLDTVLDG